MPMNYISSLTEPYFAVPRPYPPGSVLLAAFYTPTEANNSPKQYAGIHILGLRPIHC